MKALVLVHLAQGKERSYLQAVKKAKGVKMAVLTTGRYDAVVEVEASSFDDIINNVLGGVRGAGGVTSSETLFEVE